MSSEGVERDREEGEYWEEVDGIVDSVLDLVREGELTNKYAVYEAVSEAAERSGYVRRDELCRLVLTHSEHQTAFFDNGSQVALDHDFERFRLGLGGPASLYRTPMAWDCGRKPFPWAQVALAAMKADCHDRVQAHKELRDSLAGLPVREGHGHGEEGEEAEEDEEIGNAASE